MNYILRAVGQKNGGYEDKPNDQFNRVREFLAHSFLLLSWPLSSVADYNGLPSRIRQRIVTKNNQN